MKKRNQFFQIVIGVFLLLLTTTIVKAQTPTYLCKVLNLTQVSCNVFEFDIYLQRTGANVFKFAGIQTGINIDPANATAFINGGTITVSPVPNSSGLLTAQKPGPERFYFDNVNKCIVMTAVPPPGSTNATTIVNTSPGTKVVRVRVTNSVAFGAVSPGLTWSFGPVTYETKVTAYIGTTNTNVTASGTFSVPASQPAFTTGFGTPVAQTVTGGGAYCNVLGGPGVPIGLATSEVGFSYHLYKDGIAVVGNSGVIAGTGSAISFADQTLAGVYTVKSPSCTGLVDMLNPVTITILQPLATDVSIAGQSNVCAPATPLTYTATPTNGGTPFYQWYLNGNTVGLDQATYTYTPADGDQLYVEMTSSEVCVTASPATSNTITVTVSPTVAASVGMGVSQNNICAGTQVTYTANPTNGGTPTYQWYKNSVMVGTNAATFIDTPANGDQVYVVMTSSTPCATGSPATSTTVTMIVNPTLPVSVALGVDQNNLCTPVPVTFTATPTNGGNAVYQWYLNGAAVGANQPTYTYTPANGQEVYVMMTSDVLCPTGNPATSSTITMNILPAVAASVGVAPDANNVCAGVTVNFTATPTNGGTPTYQWYVGTSMVGTNSPTYSYAPANGDQVYCVMTSTAPCVTGSPATSATVAMVVNPVLPVSVAASPNVNNICTGTSVTFTATPTNGGTPTYQWYKNSFPVGTNSPTYSFVPVNLDQVSVVMTSNLSCVSGNPATSGSTAMVVDPCTGIDENLSDVSSLYVYPNPSSDKLYVNFNELKEVPKAMKLINAMGQVCFESNMPLQTNQNGIDVSSMSTGMYTLQIVFENETVNKQVIVKK